MNPNSQNSNLNSIGSVKLTNAAGGFTSVSKAEEKKIEPTNPFVKAGYIFLGLSVAASIAIFFADRYLEKLSQQTLEESLKYKSDIGSLPLANMHDLLNKLTALDDISNKHTNIITLFEFMETITNKNVFWENMSVNINENGIMEVNLNGIGNSYAAVIQQLDEFNDPKYKEYISTPTLSGAVSRLTSKSNNKTEIKFGIKFNFLVPYKDSNDGAIFDKLLYGYNIETDSKLNASSTIIVGTTTRNTTATSGNTVIKITP